MLIFEIVQPVINAKRFSRGLLNNYVMKHNDAIINQFYLHVGYFRILRKQLVTVRDVLNIVMCFCISTLPVRQNNALNNTAYVLIFKAILKCPFLRDNTFCVVK